MAIALLTASGGAFTQGSPGSNDTTIPSVDLGTGNNRVLLLWVTSASAGTFSAATAGGQAMSAHTQGSSLSSMGYRFFYLGGASLPTGTNDIVFTESGTPSGRSLYAIYSGVDSATPIDTGTLANYNASTSTPSTNVASAAGNLVVMMGAGGSQTPFTEGSGVVQDFEAAFYGSTMAFGVWSKAGEATTTMNGSLPGSVDWLSTVVELNAASSGGGVPKSNRLLLLRVGD